MSGDRQTQLEDQLDVLLRRLPPEFAVASQEMNRLVLGGPGAFVLTPLPRWVPRDVEPMAARTTRLAGSTRAVLADHLSWVPFIDSVIVTASTDGLRAAVTVAPIDLVDELLTGGPTTITASTMTRVRELLRTNRLGSWRAGIGPMGGRIDLCDPMPTTSNS